ncbi:MAG TPA: hypothetical protein DIU45_17320 [Clostridium sp.]|nr:hypothetical protein [Clostridium sp.]
MKNFPYIKNFHMFFDKVFSFDKEDVEAINGIEFLPLFYTERYEKIAERSTLNSKYDFSFIGTAHPKKYKFIKDMSYKLKDTYPRQFIYFFFPSRLVYFYRKFKNPELKKAKYSEFHFTSLSGSELDQVIVDSSCILDSAQDGQIGLTIRVLEALGAKKKLITTNCDVVNYDFYCEENIYVYSGNFDRNNKFFTEPYKSVPYQIYIKYSLRNWLSELLDKEV